MSARSSMSSSSSSSRRSLFLRVHSADKLQLSTSLASFCTLYLGETPVTSTSPATSDHFTFSTNVTASSSKLSALWNEKFEVPVDDATSQILSVRVQNQHQRMSPAIGACAIPLKQVRVGHTVDQSFPLYKGTTPVGTIRLQLMLKEKEVPLARVVDDAVAVKKTVKKMTKKINFSDGKDDEYQGRDSMSLRALERERRRLEEEEEERKRRERDRAQQLAMEKKKIEEKMEQLRREEEERAERRRLAAEQEEQQRIRRQWELQEEELARRDGYTVHQYDNQIDKNLRPSMGRSRLSVREMLDMVVQDALPSDSDDSEELDTEDEHELIRQIAKLKLQMKKKKRAARQRLLDAQDPTKPKAKPKVVYVYEDAEAERLHKAKSTKKEKSNQSSGPVKQVVKKAQPPVNNNQNNQNNGITVGQVIKMASLANNIATMALGLEDQTAAEAGADAAVEAFSDFF